MPHERLSYLVVILSVPFINLLRLSRRKPMPLPLAFKPEEINTRYTVVLIHKSELQIMNQYQMKSINQTDKIVENHHS